MMTNVTDRSPLDEPSSTPAAARRASTQKVVIINGSPEVLELLETVLDAGHYDLVFVESSAHAYSQVKRVKPDLVILCVSMKDGDGLQVLSMLKLDAETRSVPIVTYTTTRIVEETSQDVADTSDAEIFSPKPAVWMN
jgi:CheY-like chemotaxis protein